MYMHIHSHTRRRQSHLHVHVGREFHYKNTQLTRKHLGVHQSCCQLITAGVLKMEHWNEVWSETSFSEHLRSRKQLFSDKCHDRLNMYK